MGPKSKSQNSYNEVIIFAILEKTTCPRMTKNNTWHRLTCKQWKPHANQGFVSTFNFSNQLGFQNVHSNLWKNVFIDPGGVLVAKHVCNISIASECTLITLHATLADLWLQRQNLHMYIYAYVHIHMYIIYTYIYVYIYVCICSCMYINISMYIQIYMHAQLNIHTHE